MIKVKDVRRLFVRHFEEKGHRKMASSSLVPEGDPTLLFTNAGMVQFKDLFTGKAIAAHPRAVTIQKCLRAGGKHNDLENVGFTPRHHTFFEMLGNFSFGNYFKEDAISFAWEFLTEVLEISKEKLYVTVHHSDEEAASLWHQKMGIPKSHIFYRGDKDNFWEMGEVGPCGPCTEIFFDHGDKHSTPGHVGEILDDEQRYIEIWNLVFMQFEKFSENGRIHQRSLPRPSVDTGAGLERLVAALQDCYCNYDTDLFLPIISEIEKISGKSYKTPHAAVSMRVVADHVRAATMMITDGVLPSNEGRGYVLRRIMRRAIRHLDQLGVKVVSLDRLVAPVFEVLGEEYPENLKNKSLAEKYLALEEENFRSTLSSGLQLLEREMERLKEEGGSVLDGGTGFKLYDTHGFPIDLTEVLLKENGLEFDHEGFEIAMEEQRERSRSHGEFSVQENRAKEFYSLRETFGETLFVGYEKLSSDSKLLAVVAMEDGKRGLVFDQTPFYGEAGGQVGDKGFVQSENKNLANVITTIKPVENLFIHVIGTSAKFEVGKVYHLKVDGKERALTACHHTATHLLQKSLSHVLGDHVKQAGSLVSSNRLRFDFTHPESLRYEELIRVEKMVNDQIRWAIDVKAQTMTKDEAIKQGATALFGEKYGSEVRVIRVGDFSQELCGGTHVENTRQIGYFRILSESSLASGVRRIEAVAGEIAFGRIREEQQIIHRLELLLGVKGGDVETRVAQLMESLKLKEKELRDLKEKLQSMEASTLFSEPEMLEGGIPMVMLSVARGTDLRRLADLFFEKHPKGVVFLSMVQDERAAVLLRTFEGNAKLDCAAILKKGLESHQGKGGGKRDMAQGAVGRDQLTQVESQIRELIVERMRMSK